MPVGARLPWTPRFSQSQGFWETPPWTAGPGFLPLTTGTETAEVHCPLLPSPVRRQGWVMCFLATQTRCGRPCLSPGDQDPLRASPARPRPASSPPPPQEQLGRSPEISQPGSYRTAGSCAHCPPPRAGHLDTSYQEVTVTCGRPQRAPGCAQAPHAASLHQPRVGPQEPGN